MHIVDILIQKKLHKRQKTTKFAKKLVNNMENQEKNEQEILFSRAVKAGKRIYYLDVKQNRNNDLFLAITESKKIVNGEGENAPVTFEKHKIFLYKEDFEKFAEALHDVMQFTNEVSKDETKDESESAPVERKFDIDINFDL